MSSADLQRLLSAEEQKLRRAVNGLLGQMRSPLVVAHVVRLLRSHNMPAALSVISHYLQQLAGMHWSQSFLRVARAEVLRAQRALPHRRVHKIVLRKQVELEFDATDPRAVDIMRRSSLSMVRDFSARQRRSLRAALADSLRRGEGPAKQARTIRDAIGLTENQYRAVDNYRALLERNSSQALERTLRDRRFDSRLKGAIERGDVLSDEQIGRMVDRYSRRMLDYRAQAIARTESHRALSQARHAAWGQLLDQADIKSERLQRTWNTNIDGRERETHHAMDGQTVQGLDEPFRSPSGALLMYPGDPSAPPEETIHCRCTETYEIGEAA